LDRIGVEINEMISKQKPYRWHFWKTSKYRGLVIVTGGLGPTKMM
jgi:molybdopterin-biosynthesis enzyme MoeA-like protein